MNLGIGTAQFGMHYGISNRDGQTPRTEVKTIFRYAAELGVRVIDTAHGYGESETVLGETLPDDHAFRIVTKTPAFPSRPLGPEDAVKLENSFRKSLAKLKQQHIYGLLLHNADDLFAEGGSHLHTELLELKGRGLVERIGVSVYTGEQIDMLLDLYEFDLIQLSVNVLDQRLITSGRIAALKERGIEVHARSIFLQGLLLMPPEEIPSYFQKNRPLLEQYHALRRERGLSAIEAAFCFIKGITDIDEVIIGADNLNQFVLNMAAFRKKYNSRDRADLGGFGISDPQFLNPACWNLKP